MPPSPITTAWLQHNRTRPAEARVREWLALRLQLPAAAIPLTRDARGRPQLTGALSGQDISWSHSGEALLVAHGTGVRLGVDVECCKAGRDFTAIAERHFTPSEATWLRAQPEAARLSAFHRLWCAKEALLKAHGTGLVFGLAKLEFTPDAEGALTLTHCDPALGHAADWTLQEWAPCIGYRAALAWRPAILHP